VQVFLGMLPCYVVLHAAASPEIGPLDWLAAAVAFGAIKLEADADKQLHAFVTGPRAEGDTLTTGLWGVSRHPNYLGEILFWWGLYLFGLAANPAWWWTIIGPLCITLLFVFVSLPLIEERATERRRNYDAVRAKVPILLPRLRGGR